MDCKRCGAPLLQGVILCPECGARQHRRVNTVRCASCHRRVPLELTVCPHCGRDVRPAGPRWVLWLAALLAIVLVSLWGLDKLPIARINAEVSAVREQVSGLVQVLGPINTPTPSQPEPVLTPAPPAAIAEARTPTAAPPASTPAAEATPISEATAPGDAAEVAVEGFTATPTMAPTAEPTATATLTPAPTATASPQPTFTATPQPVAGGAATYRVQSGDTLSSIAERFGISWEALAAANGLNSRSVLRIGQELIIPASGVLPTPTATATPRPMFTATPLPPTPTPAPQLAAPALLNPGDQTPYSGASANIELTWEPVAGMGPTDQYQVIVRWTEQGAPQEHYWLSTAAGSRLPGWLWSRADQPARQYTWYVQAVRVTTDGQGGERIIPLSPPSQSRVFYWG